MLFIGRFYAEGGFDIPFSIWLSELAKKFPKEKTDTLKFLIQCKFWVCFGLKSKKKMTVKFF